MIGFLKRGSKLSDQAMNDTWRRAPVLIGRMGFGPSIQCALAGTSLATPHLPGLAGRSIRTVRLPFGLRPRMSAGSGDIGPSNLQKRRPTSQKNSSCLLYTSDAADE